MPGDEDVAAQLPRFELVEWQYDGLNGKVIPWTKEHGGASDDPSAQAFVVRPDGTVAARAQDCYTPSRFAKWLDEQADAFEKANPRTRMAFVPLEPKVDGEGEARKAAAPALDAALGERRPVLLFVGRSRTTAAAGDALRAEKAEVAASRKLETGVLDSKTAADAAEGWGLFRLDLADPDQALLASQRLAVKSAPALLLLLPGESDPVNLGAKITAGSLAFRLKKHAVVTAPDADDGDAEDGE